MENQENNEINEKPLMINEEIADYLTQTAKWGKFLAIMGFIGIGLILLLSIFMIGGASFMENSLGANLPGSKISVAIITILYPVIGIIYFFPVWYLYKFSVQIKQGIVSNTIDFVTSGFKNLKSLFKYIGIMTIVILSIYILTLLAIVPTIILFAKH